MATHTDLCLSRERCFVPNFFVSWSPQELGDMIDFGLNQKKNPCTSFDAMGINSKVAELLQGLRDHLKLCKAFSS